MKYEEFLDFCKDETRNQIEWDNGSLREIIVKVRAVKNLVVLYHEMISTKENRQYLAQSGKFQAEGFYNVKSGVLYNLGYSISSTISDYEDYQHDSINEMQVQTSIDNAIASKINDIVMKLYAEGKFNFDEGIEKESCKSVAYNDYMKNIKPGDLSFRDFITHSFEMADKDIDGYTTDPDNYADKMSDEIIKEKQKEFLTNYKYFIALKKELECLYTDKESPFNVIKKVKDCIHDEKTVNVVIFKNGQTFSFKTGTRTFNCTDGKYSSWDMNAPDRKRYKSLFGNNFYAAKEIQTITYGKKTLYKREE